MNARRLLLASLLAAAPPAAQALQHDLFARPALDALKPASGAPVKTVTAPPPPTEWKPELRAIIRGAGGAMVNVEGRIVQMGQEMDGYRLVDVQDRTATFVREKVRYTLALKSLRPAEAAPAVAKPVEAPTASSKTAEAAPGEPRGLGTLKTSDVLSGPIAARAETPDRRRE